MYMKRT